MKIREKWCIEKICAKRYSESRIEKKRDVNAKLNLVFDLTVMSQ